MIASDPTAAIGTRIAQIDAMFASMRPQGVAASAATTSTPATAATSATSSTPQTTTFSSALDNATQSQAATATTATAGTATAGSSVVSSSTPFASQINAAAAKYGISAPLLGGLIKQESGFNPNARSGAGAVGLTQLMPSTAAGLGVTDPLDPAQAIDGGAKYLKEQLDKFGGDASLALAAYNAGPGAVQKYGGVPPYAETQGYVKNVLANANALGGGLT
jgi:soluble lytic murein transglycosylase-like protein